MRGSQRLAGEFFKPRSRARQRKPSGKCRKIFIPARPSIRTMEPQYKEFCEYLRKPMSELYAILKYAEDSSSKPQPHQKSKVDDWWVNENGKWKKYSLPEPPEPPAPFGNDPYSSGYTPFGKKQTDNELYQEALRLNRMIADYVELYIRQNYKE